MIRPARLLLAAALPLACSAGGTTPHRPAVGDGAGGTASGIVAGGVSGMAASAAGVSGSTPPPVFHVDAGPKTRMGCNDVNVGFEKLIPTVLLLVDESGSMSDNKYPQGGSQSRWRVLHDALLADGGLVQTLEAEVRFGFIGYTGDGTAATCPILQRTDIFAEGSTMALDAIRTAYPQERPSLPYAGETPTGAALRSATSALAAYNAPGPKYIVLATDGDPDTCARPNPQCGQEEAVTAAQAAYAAGIGMFVIGISDEVASWHLQQMANAGAGLDVTAPPDTNFYNTCPRDPSVTPKYAPVAPAQNAKFYKPADGSALAQALSSILYQARTCTFTLHGKVTKGKESLGSVRLDGVPLSYMESDGWRLDDDQTLEVLGASCDKIKTSGKLLQISFPCDSVTILR